MNSKRTSKINLDVFIFDFSFIEKMQYLRYNNIENRIIENLRNIYNKEW